MENTMNYTQAIKFDMKRFFFLSLLLLCFHVGRVSAQIPEYEALPISVAQPSLPNIPDRWVDLKDFGGVGDGVTSNTEAFARAIAALSKQGGGHLRVSAGLYLTGLISLKDKIDLHLEKHAVILFSPDKTEFFKRDKVTGKPVSDKATPCITASSREDVSITGEGILDGNGEWWRAVKRSKVSDVEWNRFQKMGGMDADHGMIWYPFDLKHFQNIAESYELQEAMRTHLVRFTECTRVLVEGVTLQNSPKFHLVPQRCTDVVIRNVSVRCPWNAQNGDGIDIMNSRRVWISGCTVDVGDDAICLKAGAGAAGVKAGPCEDIVITNNTVYHGHGGFVIGSEFSGGMNRIVVKGNTFCGTDTGLRFKSAPGRGGKTSQIYISDIFMSDIAGEAVVFETTYVNRPVGQEGNTLSGTADFLPEFTDIHIRNVVCRDAQTAVSAAGTLEMIHGIRLENCTFFYAEKGCQMDNEGMITMKDVVFKTY